jgi:hypothetical protein
MKNNFRLEIEDVILTHQFDENLIITDTVSIFFDECDYSHGTANFYSRGEIIAISHNPVIIKLITLDHKGFVEATNQTTTVSHYGIYTNMKKGATNGN